MSKNVDSGALRLQTEKLNLASEHVNTNWLPVNLNLIEEIIQKIDSGYYSENRNQLIDDLKSDVGLLIFCIKELSFSAKTKAESIYQKLRNFDNSEILFIVKKCRKNVTAHKLSESSVEQLNQLNSLITSSAVSETMAGVSNLDSEIVFLSALFRQIGMTFIAWNYPNVFKNCLGSSQTEEEMMENLNMALGFSPAMLGVRLAKEWQVPSQIIRVMSPDSQPASQTEQPSASLSPADLIIKLCKIGELLAGLNNENYQYKPEGAWNHARNEILKSLGSKGFQMIEQNIHKLSSHYSRLIPTFSQTSIAKKIELANKRNSGNSLFHSNAYVKFLSPEVQEELREFYNLISPEGLSKDSVSFLHGKLIPVMGFTEGCLYLIDPTAHSLLPRLAFGTKKLSEYKSIDLIAHENHTHPLIKAFNASSPLAKTESGSNEVLYISGSLGSLQKSGVLYLELSQALRMNNKVNPTLYFRALIRGLEDCLGLR